MVIVEKIKEAPRKAVVFYNDVRTELKKVTWPNKKEVYGTTVVVIAAVFFFGFYLSLVDVVLNYAVNAVFAFFQ